MINEKEKEISLSKHKNSKLKEITWQTSKCFVTLSDIATIKTSKRVLTSDYKTSGFPFLKGSDLEFVENDKSIKEINYISSKKFIELKKKSGSPQKGDILVTGNGTIGKTFIVRTTEEFYIKDGILWITENSYDCNYLHLYISDHIMKYVERLSYGSTITNLNIELLRTLPIPKINKDLQKDIASTILKLKLQEQLLDNEYKQLLNIKKYILSKMLV